MFTAYANSGADAIVIVDGADVIVERAAVIEVEPVPMPLTSPREPAAVLIAAMLESADIQVTAVVRFRIELSV